MRNFIRQLKETSCGDLFHCMRDKAEENGITIYMVEYTLGRASLMFTKENEYLVLCIAFSDKKENRLVDEDGYALSEEKRCFCPISYVRGMRDKLGEICRNSGVTPMIYMGVMTEYELLNSKEDWRRWDQEGFSFVFDRVPMDVKIKETAYSKALRIGKFIHAK